MRATFSASLMQPIINNMQYPQIQFYRGSLVRLATGELKQVEDLSSDDFIGSAKLSAIDSRSHCNKFDLTTGINKIAYNGLSNSATSLSAHTHSRPGNGIDTNNNNCYAVNNNHAHHANRNGSVFNSPEPTSSFGSSPALDMMDLDMEPSTSAASMSRNHNSHRRGRERDIDVIGDDDDDDDDDSDRELDVVSDDSHTNRTRNSSENITNIQRSSSNHSHFAQDNQVPSILPLTTVADYDEKDLTQLQIDSSVVRDLREVGVPSTSPSSLHTGSSSSLSSSASSLHQQSIIKSEFEHMSSTSTAQSSTTLAPTILIKFFLESSRSVVFIEVPTEHPFFVYHRGWSSWNPQRTYEKFGLKCRKLKIGDSCISLSKKPQLSQTNAATDAKSIMLNDARGNANRPSGVNNRESDQCNIMFSSIKIH